MTFVVVTYHQFIHYDHRHHDHIEENECKKQKQMIKQEEEEEERNFPFDPCLFPIIIIIEYTLFLFFRTKQVSS